MTNHLTEQCTSLAPEAPPEADARHESPWLFVALCGYLLSQAYTVPVLAMGPSWAVWPSLPDVAAGLLLTAWICTHGSGPLPQANARVVRFLGVAIVLAACSYVAANLLLPLLDNERRSRELAVVFGAYSLCRSVEFLVVFLAASSVSMNARRLQVLRTVAITTLVVVCCGIVATWQNPRLTAVLTLPLPSGKDTAGAWASFLRGTAEPGNGLISYNHGYTACHVLLLWGLVIHLGRFRPGWMDSALILLSFVTVFLTGSRAGFGAAIIFLIVCFCQMIRIGRAVPFVCLIAVAGSIVGGVLVWDAELWDRQFTAFQFHDVENLSGRDEIWDMWLRYLNEDPYRWVTGVGFGAALSSGFGVPVGNNVHLLPFHVTAELGIGGLLMFSWAVVALLKGLWADQILGHGLFWVTIVLLITSASQETFYPVAAMGHFLGFYLCVLGIALRVRADVPHLNGAGDVQGGAA